MHVAQALGLANASPFPFLRSSSKRADLRGRGGGRWPGGSRWQEGRERGATALPVCRDEADDRVVVEIAAKELIEELGLPGLRRGDQLVIRRRFGGCGPSGSCT